MILRNVLGLGAGVALVGLLLAGCAGAPAAKSSWSGFLNEAEGRGKLKKNEGDVAVNNSGLGDDQCRSVDGFFVFGPASLTNPAFIEEGGSVRGGGAMCQGATCFLGPMLWGKGMGSEGCADGLPAVTLKDGEFLLCGGSVILLSTDVNGLCPFDGIYDRSEGPRYRQHDVLKSEPGKGLFSEYLD